MAKKEVQIKLSANATGVVSAFTTAGKAITRFSTTATNLGNKLGGVFNPLMTGLATVTTTLGVASASLAGVTLKIGAGFEDSMLAVKGVTQATNDEMEQLAQKARDIGKVLPVTAQQTADAMYNLASAGMSTKEILESIDDVVALSISQGFDLAESGGLMVSTLRAFNLEATESGRVVDVFANGISNSMLTMHKLIDSLKYAAPIAATFGVSLEETVASMEALANAGLSGEQIGTGMRGVIAGLADPTTRAQVVLDRLGVSTVDANGKLRSLIEIFKDLKAAGAEGADFLQIFERRMATPAAVLTSMADQLDGFQEGLAQAGRNQELLNERMKGFKNIAISVVSAVQEGFLTAFDGIQEQAKAVTVQIRDLINAFVDWARETNLTGQAVTAFFRGLGVGLVTVEDLKENLNAINIDDLIAKFKSFGEGIRSVGTLLKGFASAVPWKFITTHAEAITKTIITGWLTGKVALVAGAVSGLAVVFTQFGVSVTKLTTVIGITSTTSAGGLIPALALLQVKLSGLMAAMSPWVLAGGVLFVAVELFKGLRESMTEGTEAANAYKKALASTVEELKKLTKEEIVHDIQSLERQMASMEAHMGGPNGSGNVKGNAQYKVWEEQLGKLKEALEAVEEGAKETSSAITDIMKQHDVDAQQKSMAYVFGFSDDTSESVKAFSDDVATAVQQAASEFSAYAMELTAKTADIKTKFGLSGEEAGRGMKDALLAKAQEMSDGLVEQFDNPALRVVLLKAFEGLADKAGGGFYDRLKGILEEAMDLAKEKVLSIEEQLNAALNQATKNYGGEWKENTVLSEDENTKVVQLTNGVVYLRQELTKTQEKANKGFSFDGMLSAVNQFKDGMSSAMDPSQWGWGPNQMVDEVTGAIYRISDPAESVGDKIGAGLYEGIMAGVDKAVTEAKRKLKSLNLSGFDSSSLGLTDAMRGDL